MKHQSAIRDSKPKSTLFRSVGARVVKLALPHLKILCIGLVALALGSGLNLLFPHLIGKFFNIKIELSTLKDIPLSASILKDLPSIIFILIGLFALQAIVFCIRHFCFAVVGYHVVSELRKNLFITMTQQDIAFFDNARVGDLLSRLSSDTELVQRAVTINISVALRYIIQVIGGTVLMFIISWRLSIIILLIVPIISIASKNWGKKLRSFSRKLQNKLGECTVIAEETLGAMRTVRIFAGEKYETSRYSYSILQALTIGIDRTKVAAIFSSTMVFLMNASIACVLWYGIVLVASGRLSVGALATFLLYCVIVAVSFGFLINVWDEFMQALGAAERVFEIIDCKPSIVTPISAKTITSRSPASVRFDQVDFYYPSRPEVKVLEDISFEIKEGSTIALVGPSGSGKSTIASLIPRFYDPQKGSIYFSGINLPEIDLDSLRNQISIVAQDPQVFALSIGANIAYGNLKASNQEIAEAARSAHIEDFIESLPEKYDTLVGDRGIQLSGGQKQRIAIARALLKDPKFLILDEATSALDSENEKLVQEALIRLMKGRTTLVIAHRLSTVQYADQVIVLKSGKIVQSGSHESLMNQPGLYQTLVTHQLL